MNIPKIRHRSRVKHEQARKLQAILRSDLNAFTEKAFHQINPGAKFYRNWHLDTIAWHLQQCAERKIKRLIITVPPRSLKSICASVAFPAFLLGRDPACEVICASYSNELSAKHARDFRMVFNANWYQDLFKGTRVDKKKDAALELVTTKNGGRYATSVEGTMTGRGGDFIIIDDPIKPDGAMSEAARNKVNEWFDGTVYTRLNNRKDDVIIIVMQRLHEDDLVGHVLELEDWTVLNIPATADNEMEYRTGDAWDDVYVRKAGELIDPRREDEAALAQLKRTLGSYKYSAQYQQNPMPVEGNLVKEEWLKTYEHLPELDSFDGVFLSWDTATKGSERADYSVCTVWGVMGLQYYVIEVVREKLDYPDLRNLAFDLVEDYSPHTVLVEDAVTGTALAQELRKEYHLRVLALTPKGDKEIRFSAQSAVFEQGRVLLPEKASWRDEFVKELLAFPGTKYDDQVDSVELFLRHVNGRREIHPQGERPRIRNRPRGTPRRFYPRAYLRSITGLQGDGSSLW